MKTYKALVENKENGKLVVLTVEAENKADAKKDIRLNGYTIRNNRCLESKYYDYVVENTNCEKWDWEMALYRESNGLEADATVEYELI